MSAGAITTAPAAPALRPMRFDDYERVRALLADHAMDSPSFDDWRHRWVDNPVWRRSGDARPIGWVLETAAGAIVGSIESIPALYTFRGSDLVAAASSAWCVEASYRGYALQLINEYFDQPVDLFISTTVGRSAVETLNQFYGPVPLGAWDAVSYFVTEPVLVAKRALQKHKAPLAPLLAYPTGWMLRLKNSLTGHLPKPSRSVVVEATDRFDARFDAFWAELVRENRNKLLAERSSRALSWHFDAAIRENRLWIFTASKMGRLCGYCVLRRESWLGGEKAILIDYQNLEPEPDLLPDFLRAALQRCAAEGFLAIQNFGRGVPKMRAFDERATYRGRLANSIFFYGAVDAALQAELSQAERWDPSLFDGDATL
ncbi:MAG: hypothetical protein WAK16_07500 [Candidatus Cybelea sp.]